MTIDKEKGLDLAQKLVVKGQYKKAIAEYVKLIESDPKDTRLYLKLGDLYFKIGDHDKAVAEYMKLANLYEGEDLNSRAISLYKKILSINPKHLDALHRIAALYIKEGLPGDAKNYYQTILKLNPEDQEAIRALKDLDTRSQSAQISKNDLIAFPMNSLETQPHPPLKPLDDKSDLFPTSVVQLQSATTPLEGLSKPDKDSETHYHLGIAYREMELYDYAISEFEQAALNPSRKFDSYIMLGSCYLEKGDHDQAIHYFKEAAKIQGLTKEKLARIHFNLGLVFEAKGMVSQAVATFRQALSFDQSFAEAQEKIRKLHQHDK